MIGLRDLESIVLFIHIQNYDLTYFFSMRLMYFRGFTVHFSQWMAVCISESGIPCLEHPLGGYRSTCHGFYRRSWHIQGRNSKWLIVEGTDIDGVFCNVVSRSFSAISAI